MGGSVLERLRECLEKVAGFGWSYGAGREDPFGMGFEVYGFGDTPEATRAQAMARLEKHREGVLF